MSSSPRYQTPYPVTQPSGKRIIWDWNKKDWVPYTEPKAAAPAAPASPSGSPGEVNVPGNAGEGGGGGDQGGSGGEGGGGFQQQVRYPGIGSRAATPPRPGRVRPPSSRYAGESLLTRQGLLG